MADIQINVAAGSQTRLLTAQKYCPSDILVKASAGSENFDFLLTRTPTVIKSNITALADSALYSYPSLTSISLPKMTDMGSQSLYATTIKRLYFPSLATVRSNCIGNSDTEWFFAPLQYIYSNAFRGSEVTALIIPYDGLCTLQAIAAFASTPIASGAGYIYLPDALVAQYKVATNWANYAAQIRGLSELPAEVQEWLDQQGGASE